VSKKNKFASFPRVVFVYYADFTLYAVAEKIDDIPETSAGMMIAEYELCREGKLSVEKILSRRVDESKSQEGDVGSNPTGGFRRWEQVTDR